MVEVEWLKRVKQEVSEILIYISVQDCSIEAVQNPSTIHDLGDEPRINIVKQATISVMTSETPEVPNMRMASWSS